MFNNNGGKDISIGPVLTETEQYGKTTGKFFICIPMTDTISFPIDIIFHCVLILADYMTHIGYTTKLRHCSDI